MRKKNLKFTAGIIPSRLYLFSVLALHTLASVLSVCIDLSAAQHLFALASIAASLCYQLGVYAQNACWVHVSFEADHVTLRSSDIVYFPHNGCAPYQNSPTALHKGYCGELLLRAWILPKLIILHIQMNNHSCKTLTLFLDSLSKDDFRKLRVFILNNIFLHTQK